MEQCASFFQVVTQVFQRLKEVLFGLGDLGFSALLEKKPIYLFIDFQNFIGGNSSGPPRPIRKNDDDLAREISFRFHIPA